MEVMTVLTEKKMERRPYRPPVVRSEQPRTERPVLLACTGRFDCEEIVGFPCCADNDQCLGC